MNRPPVVSYFPQHRPANPSSLPYAFAKRAGAYCFRTLGDRRAAARRNRCDSSWSVRGHQPVRRRASAEALDVEAQDDEIVLDAAGVLDVVSQQRLGLVAHRLEHGDRADLIGRHLHGQLLDAARDRQLAGLRAEHAAQALAARPDRDDDAQLGDVRRPRKRIARDRRAAGHLGAAECEQRRQRTALDLVHPRRENFRVRDVARQEQQVVRRQLAREREHRGFVARAHEPQLVRRIGERDRARIGARRRVAHTERTPSHASSRGHKRLTAFGPATRLTWPPLSTISSLSAEPTWPISGFAASYGTMWSCSAIACSIGAVIAPRSTRRPPTTSSFLCKRFSQISSLMVSRKYSPASGSVSVDQRSNARYERTNRSSPMFSQSCA